MRTPRDAEGRAVPMSTWRNGWRGRGPAADQGAAGRAPLRMPEGFHVALLESQTHRLCGTGLPEAECRFAIDTMPNGSSRSQRWLCPRESRRRACADACPRPGRARTGGCQRSGRAGTDACQRSGRACAAHQGAAGRTPLRLPKGLHGPLLGRQAQRLRGGVLPAEECRLAVRRVPNGSERGRRRFRSDGCHELGPLGTCTGAKREVVVPASYASMWVSVSAPARVVTIV
jgi:hypothetical protein